MKAAKILAIFLIFWGTVLLGDVLSKLYAEENITVNDISGTDILPERKESPFFLVRMEEWRKHQPMQSDEPSLPIPSCMDLYENFYKNAGRENSPPPPSGTSPACESCLRNHADAGRPWSDAVRYCHDRCCR